MRLKQSNRTLQFIIVCMTAATLLTNAAHATRVNGNIEMAARINIAENICDINFGKKLLHFVMLGAHDMRISIEDAARLADKRHLEIVRYLNKNKSLDRFCQNARSGRL